MTRKANAVDPGHRFSKTLGIESCFWKAGRGVEVIEYAWPFVRHRYRAPLAAASLMPQALT